jgi:PAS domain S-box-containing protein
MLWAIGLGFLLAAGLFIGTRLYRPRIEDRVYRIGWQEVPPFQQKGKDGNPSGVAVDLVRDAARRRGIRLEWVWYPGSSEAALRNREVDLWPLITLTPERRGVIHISKPYLQHNHHLLVLASSGYVQLHDLDSASVSYRNLPINQQLVQRVLPRARLSPAATHQEAVASVCQGSTDAVFLDEFSGATLPMSGISCPSQSLRVIPLPTLKSSLGVGSTLEFSFVADEIRRGINESSVEGELARILANQGYYSPHNLEYFTALLNAERRERWLTVAAGTFAALLVMVVIAAHRIRRQRDRIRSTGEALRQSEEKLRLLANNLTDMVLAYDMERRLVFANPAVERVTGYLTDALQAEGFLSWVHPEDKDRITECWNQLFQGGAYEDEEYRLITRDGRTRWVSASWGPLFDAAGRQLGVQGSERDITERKLAEQALLESERRFRELLEDVQLVAVMTDLNGAITFCNDYTLRLTGWTRREVIGRPATEFLNPVTPFLATEQGSSGNASARTSSFYEGSIREKGGGRRWIQWSTTSLRDVTGRAAGFASLGEDVTELRNLRGEAARRASEEQFRNLSDTSPLMIWLAGPDKSCTFVNKGWLAFTGRTLEEELGTGWVSNIHPDDVETCVSGYTASFEARRDFQTEYRKRRADGEYRWVLGSGVPLFGQDGEFAGYVGTCTDITELKRGRDEDLARQKLEHVGLLAGGIAHDFNNLLGGVLSQAELALDELETGSLPDEQLKNIRAVAIRGAGIVRQLMIYAGQEDAGAEVVDVSCLIGDMRELLKVVVSKQVVLKAELDGSLPAVRANPAQLRQVVMNLVTNASEAIGPHGGVIALRTTAAAGAAANAGPNGAKTYIALEVSDTGCGIPAEAHSRVYDPFYTTKSAGHGLGLAVVQRIVHGLGGSITFETNLDHGTTFRILLPSTDEGAPPVAAARARRVREEPADPAGTVLVVEDEASLRLATSQMLRRNAFSVLEAADGTAALSLLRAHKGAIAVVLLDITLPGGPSSEVFAEARRLRPDTKLVLTSAYGPQKLDECFPGMMVDAFIRKPYQLSELVGLVRSFASKRTRDQ